MRWHLNAFAKETIVVTMISVLKSCAAHSSMQQMVLMTARSAPEASTQTHILWMSSHHHTSSGSVDTWGRLTRQKNTISAWKPMNATERLASDQINEMV